MYRRQKIPKKEAPDEGWYIILNFDKLKRPEWKQPEYYQVASLDPARDNFGFRVERWYVSGLCSGQVRPITFEKLNFKDLDPICTNLVYSRLTNFVLSKLKLLTECHYVISEAQLPINYISVRISTHVLGLIMCLTEGKGNKPIVIEVNPKLKYRQLEAPKGMTDKQLKQVWTPAKAVEILEQRGDKESVELISSSKKKDDLSDVVLQVEALNKLLGLFIVDKVKLVLEKPVKLIVQRQNGSEITSVNPKDVRIRGQTSAKETHPTEEIWTLLGLNA